MEQGLKVLEDMKAVKEDTKAVKDTLSSLGESVKTLVQVAEDTRAQQYVIILSCLYPD